MFVVEWRTPRARYWRKLSTRKSRRVVQRFPSRRSAALEVEHLRRFSIPFFARIRSAS